MACPDLSTVLYIQGMGPLCGIVDISQSLDPLLPIDVVMTPATAKFGTQSMTPLTGGPAPASLIWANRTTPVSDSVTTPRTVEGWINTATMPDAPAVQEVDALNGTPNDWSMVFYGSSGSPAGSMFLFNSRGGNTDQRLSFDPSAWVSGWAHFFFQNNGDGTASIGYNGEMVAGPLSPPGPYPVFVAGYGMGIPQWVMGNFPLGMYLQEIRISTSIRYPIAGVAYVVPAAPFCPCGGGGVAGVNPHEYMGDTDNDESW